jgi:hypothetical protein
MQDQPLCRQLLFDRTRHFSSPFDVIGTRYSRSSVLVSPIVQRHASERGVARAAVSAQNNVEKSRGPAVICTFS